MNCADVAQLLVEILEREGVRPGCWRIESRPDGVVAVHAVVRERCAEKQLFHLAVSDGGVRIRLPHPEGEQTTRVATERDVTALTSRLRAIANRGLGLGPIDVAPPGALAVGKSFVVLRALPNCASGEGVPVGSRVELVECSMIPRESCYRLAFATAGDRRRIEVLGLDPAADELLADPSRFLAPADGESCPACGLSLLPTTRLAYLCFEVMGAEYDESWYRCGCGAFAQVLGREGLSGERRDVAGPIDAPTAEACIATLRACPDPSNARCQCSAHRDAQSGW